MKARTRILLLQHGGLSPFETLLAVLSLALSSRRRADYARFASVSTVLSAGLRDDDDDSIGRGPTRRGGLRRPLLTVVGVVAFSLFFVGVYQGSRAFANYLGVGSESCEAPAASTLSHPRPSLAQGEINKSLGK